MKPQLIILINPMATHRTFCEKLINNGIKIMALRTYPPFKESYCGINKKYFIRVEKLTHKLNNDIQHIKELIKDYELIDAIPAIEHDWEYAEQIAHVLISEPTNNPQNAYLRYNKYAMNEALRQAGLNHIPQIRLRQNQTVQNISPLHFPVIIKPASDSAASFGVKVCHDIAETNEHVTALQQGPDFRGEKSAMDIIIQEKINGVEYFADSVSKHGKHYITGIYKYDKVNIKGFPIYRYIQFVNPHDPIWPLCYEYTQNVLNTLKVTRGFGHTEFMVTDNHQPYLMELNPRLSGLGGQINRLCQLLNGYDQSDIYISLMNHDKTATTLSEQYKKQNTYGRIVFLFSWKTTGFAGFNTSFLKNLRSQQNVFHLFKPQGSILSPPTNLLDIVMTISLIDKNFEAIIADTHYLQQLEKEGKLFNNLNPAVATVAEGLMR